VGDEQRTRTENTGFDLLSVGSRRSAGEGKPAAARVKAGINTEKRARLVTTEGIQGRYTLVLGWEMR